MKWLVVFCCACRFSPSDAPDDGQSDAAIDARMIDAPIPNECGDAVLCLTFEPDPLPASLPNSGVAQVSADLVSITRGERVGGGGVAELSSQSEIYVPADTVLTNILAYDFWVRVDQQPNVRYGLLDTAVPGFDSFYYGNGANYQLRCNIDQNAAYLYVTVAPLSGWNHVACSCDPPNLTLWLNGTAIGTTNAACTGGAISATYGLEVGADNLGGKGIIEQELQGAIDSVRLWSHALTQPDVCRLSGAC